MRNLIATSARLELGATEAMTSGPDSRRDHRKDPGRRRSDLGREAAQMVVRARHYGLKREVNGVHALVRHFFEDDAGLRSAPNMDDATNQRQVIQPRIRTRSPALEKRHRPLPLAARYQCVGQRRLQAFVADSSP